MKTSDQINEISKAMSIAQGEMKPASKSTVNPFFKSKYSTLAQIWDVVREPMAKNNLTILQNVASCEHGISISTRICHASGQWIEFGPLEIPLNKKDAQSVGSATSYGKRYSLSAAIGVVSEEDDDGEAAMGRSATKTVQFKVDTKTHQQPINHIDESKEMIDSKPKTINKEQWDEFHKLIKQCTSAAQDHVWCQINQMGANWGENFEVIPIVECIKLSNACLGNIAKQKKTENEVN